jgi:uncharacterized protein DUF3300
MSDFKVWAVVVGFATGLVCGVLGDDSAHAQDIWPMGTLEPPATAPLATVPAQPVAAATQPVAPIKPAALIPAVQQSTEPPLDQLVAPIALYPDPLLGQILMASTYTQEVAEAARWVRVPANRALGGDALTAALKAKGWNPSVMALAPFPSLLAIMADKLDWTQQLGKAFLARQGDVMAAVQRLRHAALATGNLKATPECHCIIQTSGDAISILPTEPQIVCVPIYNPTVVYGAWLDPDYPPMVFPLPTGFAYEPGFWIGFEPPIELAWFGPFWGWGSFDWGGGRIVVDNSAFGRLAPNHGVLAGGTWVHDPSHRGGVAYASPAVGTRFGARQSPASVATTRGAAAAISGAARRGPGVSHAGVIGRGAAPQIARGYIAPAHFSPSGGGAPHGGGPHGGGPGGHHH